MNAASYRHQLRIAEVCRSSGDITGCEQALLAFLDGTIPVADSFYLAEQEDVYTDVARALRDLMVLLREKNDYRAATTVAFRALEFFGGQGSRISAVTPRARADMFSVAAQSLPDHTLRSQFFAMAADDYLQIGEITQAASALIGQSQALAQGRNFSQAHDVALAARDVALTADSLVAETWAVRQLSELFLIGGDLQASVGVIANFLDSSRSPLAPRDVLQARAQLTEVLMRRYMSTGNEEAALAARNDAAGLYRSIGAPDEAARLEGYH